MLIVGQVVWFQAYKQNEPVQGRITRKGSSIELEINWDETDERVFYELESVGEKQNYIFTRTTAESLFTKKPSWNRGEI